MIKDIPLILLAGGKGTRLGGLTKDMSKSMVKVAGKPFIAHQLELIKRNGVNRVIIYVSYSDGCFGHQIVEFVKDGSEFGLTVQYVEGAYELGNGGAIRRALPRVGNHDFFVMYNDSYLTADFENVYRCFKSPYYFTYATAIMAVCDPPYEYLPNIELDEGWIVDYDKTYASHKMEVMDYGLSVFCKEAFDDFRKKESFDLMEVWKNLINKRSLMAYGVDICWRPYEIGSLKGLKETEEYLND